MCCGVFVCVEEKGFNLGLGWAYSWLCCRWRQCSRCRRRCRRRCSWWPRRCRLLHPCRLGHPIVEAPSHAASSWSHILRGETSWMPCHVSVDPPPHSLSLCLSPCWQGPDFRRSCRRFLSPTCSWCCGCLLMEYLPWGIWGISLLCCPAGTEDGFKRV